MSLDQKLNNGLTQLRSRRTTSKGTTFTTVESWTGPYDQLELKQDSVCLTADATGLEPTSAGHGLLTITYERALAGNPGVEQEVTVEVIWQELRRPLEGNPIFSALTADEIKEVKSYVEDPELNGPLPELQDKLYSKLIKGNTEYSTGVPLVRRTTTNVRGDVAGGNAWFRDNPPISVAGGWEFLKTADERRRDGKSYTQVEEWTGAEEWDEDLYPAS